MTHINLMAYELARRPASMFDYRGAMMVAKTKLLLRLIRKSIWYGNMKTLDGCAVLWVVPSPSCETKQNSSTYSVATSSYVESGHVNLIFDRSIHIYKRRRGRPKRRWVDSIRDDVSERKWQGGRAIPAQWRRLTTHIDPTYNSEKDAEEEEDS